MEKKQITWETILTKAQEIKQQVWQEAPSATPSDLTKRSLSALAKWKKSCCKGTTLKASNPDDGKLEFALHDQEQGCVYELKLSSANPMPFLDKLMGKVVTYNTLPPAFRDKKYHKISTVYIFASISVVDRFCRKIQSGCYKTYQEDYGFHVILHALE